MIRIVVPGQTGDRVGKTVAEVNAGVAKSNSFKTNKNNSTKKYELNQKLPTKRKKRSQVNTKGRD